MTAKTARIITDVSEIIAAIKEAALEGCSVLRIPFGDVDIDVISPLKVLGYVVTLIYAETSSGGLTIESINIEW